MILRRHLLAAISATIVMPATAQDERLQQAIAALTRESRGRLGVAVLDTGSGQQMAWHADERFPLCSTFKFLLAAAILARVDRGEDSLDRLVPVTAADIVAYSPVTETLVGGQATVAQLCQATMTLSDNGAANLLLPAIGGPPGLTEYARSIGDGVTRLDRVEPALNEARLGDDRDTTSPNAMVANLQRLLLGDALSAASRRQLTDWLIANRTGDARLRAGLPAGWTAGDKTGTGRNGSYNDIAIAWPPGRAAVLIACYLTESRLDTTAAEAVHAGVARAVVSEISA